MSKEYSRARPPGPPLLPSNVVGAAKMGLKPTIAHLRQDIPTFDEWQRQTGALHALNITRHERAIHAALIAFDAGSADDFGDLAHLVDLYDAVDEWLQSPNERTHIRKQVDDLFEGIVYRLCDFYKCSPNVLPKKLDEIHKLMVHSYAGEHHIQDPKTLAEHKLVIENGRVKQWNPHAKAVELVNTAAGHLKAAGGDVLPPTCWCDAGFVLSIWDAFYMAKHTMKIDKYGAVIGGRFHSQYMSGGQVLVAGEMTIVDGQIKKISNGSGHYRPPAKGLLPALWQLSLRGVNLSLVTACARDDDLYFVCRASDLLAYPSVCLSTANPKPAMILARYRKDPNEPMPADKKAYPNWWNAF